MRKPHIVADHAVTSWTLEKKYLCYAKISACNYKVLYNKELAPRNHIKIKYRHVIEKYQHIVLTYNDKISAYNEEEK